MTHETIKDLRIGSWMEDARRLGGEKLEKCCKE